MKFKKTETIDLDLDELPDDVYAALVPVICTEIETNFWGDGTISFCHEWDSDAQFSRCEPLSGLARKAVAEGLKKHELEAMLLEIQSAEKIIRAAMLPNA